MRSAILCVCLLGVIWATSGARTSGRSGSSGRSSSSSSGSRGWGSSSSSSGYGSRPSSSSNWNSHSSGSTNWNSHSSSSGFGSKPSLSSGTHSSGSPGYGWRASVTNPNYNKPPVSTNHHQSHVVPLSTGNRNTIKPTSRPQVYNRNTPRPITHPKPVEKPTRVTHTQSGRHNSTGSGGSHSSSFGRNATGTGLYRPSAPPMPSPGSNPHAPSAPPAPGIHPGILQGTHVGSAPPAPGIHPGMHHGTHSGSAPPAPGIHPLPGHQPSAPGWQPGVTSDAAHRQHITNNQNVGYPQAPPPYNPGHYPQAPPPYPGTNMHYPNPPPPSYYPPGGHYPPGSHYPTGSHYPVQQGPVYYPAPPPPPPGYSPYGTTYIKDRSGIRGSDVVAGLALWELMRHNHHSSSYGVQHIHHYHDNGGNYGGNYGGNPGGNSGGNYGNGGGISGGSYGSNYAENYNNYQPTYHDTMRERYTTRVTPNPRPNSDNSAYNILEMTHYITPDDKGEIYSSEGNMTCISVYNARSVTRLHQKQVNDFHKQFPDYTYPLYLPENDTMAKEFTIIPGRVIHREPISITCCGTDKGKVDLNLLTNGKHPYVNCLNNIGHIPIKKLTFIKTSTVNSTVKPDGWHPVNVYDPNNTISTPLAPFPTTSTPTPLAPFPSNTNITNPVPLAPFPSVTNITNPVLLAPFPSSTPVPTAALNVTSTTPKVDLSQTFDPLGVQNKTEKSTESPIGVTNNPSDLIIQ